MITILLLISTIIISLIIMMIMIYFQLPPAKPWIDVISRTG